MLWMPTPVLSACSLSRVLPTGSHSSGVCPARLFVQAASSEGAQSHLEGVFQAIQDIATTWKLQNSSLALLNTILPSGLSCFGASNSLRPDVLNGMGMICFSGFGREVEWRRCGLRTCWISVLYFALLSAILGVADRAPRPQLRLKGLLIYVGDQLWCWSVN